MMLTFNLFVLCFTAKQLKKYSSSQGCAYSNSPTRVPFSHRGALSDSSRSILSCLCTCNTMLMCGYIFHFCSFEYILEVFLLNSFFSHLLYQTRSFCFLIYYTIECFSFLIYYTSISLLAIGYV